MWVTTWRPHLEGVSFIRYALNFLVVIIAALLCAIVFSPATHAADAKWESGSLIYNDQSYQGPTKADKSTAAKLGIPENSEYYESIKGGATDADPKISRILYFPPGADKKDATSAQYAEYTVDDKDITNVKYTKTGQSSAVAVDKASYEKGGEKEQTSCAVNGIGYIICPIMNNIADGMDKVYDILKSFLNVHPLSTDRDGALFKAWLYMLALANLLFVAGFLVIIYSYVSNQGVKQYDLRTIIPRLIVAAVLINASYYICAIAVDASNIFGANLQDVFNTIRDNLKGNATTDPNTWKWSAITTYVLSAGTIGGVALALGTYGLAAIHLLMPMLITAIIAVLVAVVILAARQALITVLIIVAPLAFAAFILPSTQKYFNKWKDVFMTMLIMYPIFSVLFGGSQLAAMLIAQNATSVITMMLAMFVQVAPLVITPFLIKFSGSLLGKVAGIVNNPAKGLGDRAKNWSSNKADLAKNRRAAEGKFGTGLTRRLDKVKKRDEERKKAYEAGLGSQYSRSKMGRRQAVASKIAEVDHEVAQAENSTYLHELTSKKGAQYHEALGDKTAMKTYNTLHRLEEQKAVQASRQAIADDIHKADHATELVTNQALQQAAGGIGGVMGQQIATARATQTLREDFGKQVAASTELLKHFGKELNNAQLEKLAYGGKDIVGKDSQGREYKFDASAIGDAMHEAAAAKFMQETNAAGFEKFLKHVSDHQDDGYVSLNSTVKDIAMKQFSGKLPYLAGKSLDLIDQGKAGSSNIKGEGHVRMVVQTIEGGKIGPEKLAMADPEGIKNMIDVITRYNNGERDVMRQVGDGAVFAAEMSSLKDAAHMALHDDILKGKLTASLKSQLETLERL